MIVWWQQHDYAPHSFDYHDCDRCGCKLLNHYLGPVTSNNRMLVSCHKCKRCGSTNAARHSHSLIRANRERQGWDLDYDKEHIARW